MTTSKISPFAPKSFAKMPRLMGVEIATVASGMKYKNRDDLLLIVFSPGTTVAGVFTKSSTAAISVHLTEKVVEKGHGRCLLVNAGIANAFTGLKGKQSANSIISSLSKISGLPEGSIMMASTGVIGELLDDKIINTHIENLWNSRGKSNWYQAASAIKTTDTYAKGASQTIEFDGQKVNICGIAKGSGMIAPDMATMLSFIITDAKIEKQLLQNMLLTINQKSFNSITVDSDTSTNDMVLVAATGSSNVSILSQDNKLNKFISALQKVMVELAHQIVKDGEGASKFITINVTGAVSDKSAHTIAKTIANSPLVKTAIAGEDANWGRIVMAIGKSAEPVKTDLVTIHIGGILVALNGQKSDLYDELQIEKHIKSDSITIDVDLQMQDGSATVWTCDLTHEYISINADYRS